MEPAWRAHDWCKIPHLGVTNFFIVKTGYRNKHAILIDT